MIQYKDIQHLTFQSFVASAARSEVNMDELKARLQQKPYRAVDTGIHPKVMADWNRHDLLLVKPDRNKMHRFSITDFVWVKLVEKMRQYGFSLKAIKAFKDSLHHDYFEQEGETIPKEFLKDQLAKIPDVNMDTLNRYMAEMDTNELLSGQFTGRMIDGDMFETLVLLCVALRTPISFFLDHTGEGIMFNPLMLQDGLNDPKEIERLFSSSFVSISLSEILADVLLLSDLEILHGQLMLLSDLEANVLQALRDDDLSSVLIRYDKDNQMDLMEIKKLQKTEREARLMDLILKDGYQDITVKTQHGKVVYCENTRKVKLK